MRHWIYQLMIGLGFPLWLYYSYRRCRQSPNKRRCWQQLWGWVHPDIQKGAVWVHAVSLGEAQVALHLIRHLRQGNSHLPIFFTAGNDSALLIVTQAGVEGVVTSYLPLDYVWIRTKLLRTVQPRLLILVETELWPNLLLTAHRYHVPVVMIQARVSRRSREQYPRYGQPLLTNLLSPIKLIAAQTEEDRQFFISAGAKAEASVCFGNLKYDLPIAEERLIHQQVIDAPKLKRRWVWCAGSTHPDEEIPVLEAHLRLLSLLPSALLILAPRHLTHLNVVKQRLSQSDMSWIAWSDFLQISYLPDHIQVILIDQLGALVSGYNLSSACFVGGSLVPWGGHNMLEPAALRKPILTGPHNHNFSEVAHALSQAQALTIVKGAQDLTQVLYDWAQHPEKATHLGALAFDVYLSQKGGTDRVLLALSPWISVHGQEGHH